MHATNDLTLVDSIKLSESESESESEKIRFVCMIPVIIQSKSHRTPVHHVGQSQRMVRRGRERGRGEERRLRGDKVG